MSARVVRPRIIVTHLASRGKGETMDDPYRIIQQAWSENGYLLAEWDPTEQSEPPPLLKFVLDHGGSL